MSLVLRQQAFCICKNKDAVTAQLISTFVFAILIVQSLYYLNPKFQPSSHLLWPYSLGFVDPGRKPRRPVFSQRGIYETQREKKTCCCFIFKLKRLIYIYLRRRDQYPYNSLYRTDNVTV